MSQPPTGGTAPGEGGDRPRDEHAPPEPGWGSAGGGAPGAGAPGWRSPGRADGGPGEQPGGYGQPLPGYGQAPGPSRQGGYGPGNGQPGGYGYAPPPGSPGAGAKPGIIPLRPLGLGEIYDGAFQSIRTNPRVMLGVAAVVVAATSVVALLAQSAAAGRLASALGAQDPQDVFDDPSLLVGAGVSGILLPGLLEVLAVALLSGLLIVAVSRAVLGQSMSTAELWTRVRPRLLSLLVLTVVVGFAVAGAAVLCLLPGAVLLPVSVPVGALLLVVGGLLAVGVVAWLSTRWALASPALLLEGQPILGAMRRSWRLTTGSFWRVLGILLLTGVIVLVVGSIISVPFGVVSGALSTADPSDPLAVLQLTFPQLLVEGLGSILVGVLTYPFSAAVTALLYIDLRMRREGLDVELARAAAAGDGR